MAFEKNNRVFIRSLKKAGRISAVLKTGLYQVAVGALRVECKEKDLTLAGPYDDDDDLPKYVSPRASKPKANVKLPTKSHTIDLHGFTGAEAAIAVEEAVNAAL